MMDLLIYAALCWLPLSILAIACLVWAIRVQRKELLAQAQLIEDLRDSDVPASEAWRNKVLS